MIGLILRTMRAAKCRSMQLNINIYQDGENESEGLGEIIKSWAEVWETEYCSHAQLQFSETKNVKLLSVHSNLPPKLSKIAVIRNPDIYFVETNSGIELGGVEITTHSPDGSNVEKRYPYLWISRRQQVSGFVACPYSKTRGSGQKNRLPHRHSQRNLAFLNHWKPETQIDGGTIYQIVPVRELQGGTLVDVKKEIRSLMLSWSDFGAFFAHTLAAKLLEDSAKESAISCLLLFQQRLIKLAQACIDDTTNTDAASLIKLADGRWVQVYNSRPDSGHWERGEGQFDSIDGRLMFTLDEISLLEQENRPKLFEFWLPQMVSRHPWVVEQMVRLGSKRFRNIVEVLKEECVTKFADNLTEQDWQILKDNSTLLIEREDWQPGIYKVTDIVSSGERERVANEGLKTASEAVRATIFNLLNQTNLYFSTHRAYKRGWLEDLCEKIQQLPANAEVLLPRIPRKSIICPSQILCTLICAEDCNKNHLLLLRQLHRSGFWKV